MTSTVLAVPPGTLYEERDVQTCDGDGLAYIMSAEECQAAAEGMQPSLAHAGDSVYRGECGPGDDDYFPGDPRGCYHYARAVSNLSGVWFNLRATEPSDAQSWHADYDSICRTCT